LTDTPFGNDGFHKSTSKMAPLLDSLTHHSLDRLEICGMYKYIENYCKSTNQVVGDLCEIQCLLRTYCKPKEYSSQRVTVAKIMPNLAKFLIFYVVKFELAINNCYTYVIDNTEKDGRKHTFTSQRMRIN
jgi:hypothetical protein